MSDAGRAARRQVQPSAGSARAKDALETLKALRDGGGAKKRIQDLELKQEAPIYDIVEESDYAQLVSKRREEAGDFIVDDDGRGYADLGEEEDYWRQRTDGDEEGQAEDGKAASKKRKGDAAGAPGSKRRGGEAPAPPVREAGRIQTLFAKAQLHAVSAAPRAPVSNTMADDLLADILQGFGTATAAAPSCAPQSAALPPASRGMAQAGGQASLSRVAAHAPVCVGGFGRVPALPQATAARREWPLLSRDAQYAEPAASMAPRPDFVARDGGVEDEDEPMPAYEDHGHQSDALESTRPELNSRVEAGAARELADTSGALAATSPACATRGALPSTAAPSASSRMFSDVVLPAGDSAALPASGWQEMLDGDEVAEADAAPSPAAAVPPSHAAAGGEEAGAAALLEVDAETGALPFFFLDAHEMDGRPGEVFLFGKVQQGGAWQSCCCVVRGLHRSVLVVPNPSVFTSAAPEEAEELERLEAAALADPQRHVELVKHLQSCCTDVKAELRDVLSRLGVRKYRMMPVRRNYAFDNADVPHGEQYVIKVRYPASDAAMPLGTSGRTFRAVLGGQQSSLEALLLKRHLRGPGWILLRAPTRVESGNQMSWCKLEVCLEGGKGILACAPSVPAPPPGPAAGNAKVSPAEAAALARLATRPLPPLVVASLHLTTLIHPTTHQHEVVAVSVVHLAGASAEAPMAQSAWSRPATLRNFSIVRKMDGRPWPTDFASLVSRENASPRGKANGGSMLTMQTSERSLLTCLLARLQTLDADVLVGHNFSAFDLTVLLHRMQHNKVPLWSRIGRLKRHEYPKFTGGGHNFGGGAGAGVMSTTAGRLVCDTYLSARELVREVDYTLRTLAASLLGQQRAELPPSEVPHKYSSGSGLLQLLQHGESDAWLALGLMFHLSVLPLSKQLSNLSGSLWGRTLAGQRAQRIEMLLLHEFHGRKFMLPDKLSLKDKDRLKAQREAAEHDEEGGDDEGGETAAGSKAAKTSGPQYAGGLVLEPKKGLYDKYVILLDFNSLYPSIIQEYNICFTTVRRSADGGVPALPPPSTTGLAPLPTVIQGLVMRRRQVKNQMASARDPLQKQQLNIQQQAIKLTANSMYGCLGFGASRFFARPLAELITSQGRSILQSTVELVQGTIGLEVIYGDTDSIMVYTGTDVMATARELGGRVKREVNRRYKLLEIELDGVFKCMLLLKKKKYAAIKLETAPDGRMTEVMEQKGLDIVRRDWSPLCKDVGNYVLTQLLSGRPREDVVLDIHAHLRAVRESIMGGQVPLGKFIITKQLTKRPQDYPDARSQPHVQVALRRAAAGKAAVLPGETVPYIICVERPEEPLPSTTAAPTLTSTPATDLPADPAGAAAATAAGAGISTAPGEGSSSAPAAPGAGTSTAPAGAALPPAAPVAEASSAAGPGVAGGSGGSGQGSGKGAKGAAGSLAERARHPDELRENARLAVDVDYYLANQVHPVVSRLLAPIEGTDAAHVAECLGLDSQRYRGAAAHDHTSVEEELLMAAGSMWDDDETFRACDPLMLTARNGTRFEFRGVSAVLRGELPAECLLTPPDAVGDAAAALSDTQLCNQVLLRSRALVSSYYDGRLQADDELAGVDTRNVVLAPCGEVDRCAHPDSSKAGTTLGRAVLERQLYLQLSHLHRMLHVDGAIKRVHSQLQAAAGPKTRVLEADVTARAEPIRGLLTAAAGAVSAVRSSSDYHWVHLGRLLAPLADAARAH